MNIEHSTSQYRPNGRPSDAFYDQLDKCIKLHDSFNKAIEIGRSEGYTDNEINHFIRDYFKGKIPERTSRRWRHEFLEQDKQIEKEKKRQELIDSDSLIPDTATLYLGDLVKQSRNIPDNSIDMIFTDPPYGKESIPLYQNLAEIASRVLKEGGSLITYAGQYTLPNVIRELENSGLTYYWIFCVKHSGAHQAVHPRNVFVEWKPMLWFVKGDKANVVEYISDYILSQQPEKALHDWEQSVIEADHVIQRLTVENQVVLDPFMGSGTTGISALNLKRKFIGIEIDEEKYNIAKARLGNTR